MVSSNTLLQTICDNDKRGRVMSFYTMAFMGTVPLGQLLAGKVAAWISLPMMLLLSGAWSAWWAPAFSPAAWAASVGRCGRSTSGWAWRPPRRLFRSYPPKGRRTRRAFRSG